MRTKIAKILIGIISFCFISYLVVHKPIAQDISYHYFADARELFHIPNCLNTVSNVFFILVGVIGLIDLRRFTAERYLVSFKIAYIILFLGSILVGFGSGYYHLYPNNNTLIWDRLPMTLTFMALFSIVVAEFVSLNLGKKMFWPVICLGAISVIYWAVTETYHVGDLRPYVIIQFLPMLVIPIILLAFQSTFTPIYGYWLLFLCYLLAKLTEHFDVGIYHFLGFISGHSVKHILAACGLLLLSLTYKCRRHI
ncbi:MAG: ceramidase domain-containing protein [Pseudomonadota bacterium]